jgi:DNA (cytosine-5)-methyltransferase 1
MSKYSDLQTASRLADPLGLATGQRVRSVPVYRNREWKKASSGLLIPMHVVSPALPTFIDLFCGCGGFSLGFLQAGWHGLLAVDDDQSALTTYWVNLCDGTSRWIGPHDKRDKVLAKETQKVKRAKARHPNEPDIQALQERVGQGSGWLWSSGKAQGIPPVDVVACADVRELTGEYLLSLVGLQPGQVDCVIGSPPCQGFSFAGHRNVHDPRNSLVFEFARLCHEIKPRTFVMENVPGITSMVTPSGLPLVEALNNAFADADYCANWPKFERAVGSLQATGTVIAGTRRTRESREETEGPQLQLPLPEIEAKPSTNSASEREGDHNG